MTTLFTLAAVNVG